MGLIDEQDLNFSVAALRLCFFGYLRENLSSMKSARGYQCTYQQH